MSSGPVVHPERPRQQDSIALHTQEGVSTSGREVPEDQGNGPITPQSAFTLSQDDKLMEKTVTKKLHGHIMLRFCLLTFLNHMDRANLAYASVEMNADLGYSDAVYGLGSGIFFAGYMVFQIPSQLAGERVGFHRWLAFLMLGWGIIATSMVGLGPKPYHLYIIRFLLGMFEAGTFPCMWGHLTKFYAGGPQLAAAWGFIGATQPLAQVLGAPLASGLLMTDGFLHLHGWQWLFLLEGLPTIFMALWIWLTLAPTPASCKFLTPAEREFVQRQVDGNKERMAADTGAQGWWYGVRCWKVWAQGFGSGWTGIMGYGAMYWTPLIVHYILQGKLGGGTSTRDINRQGAIAALLAGVPYSWSAITALLNSWHAKRTGEMYWHLLVPLITCAVGLALLSAFLGRSVAIAFIALIIAATLQAANPIEWGYPATYLHGPALRSGWAVANCISAYGGLVGPWMIGAVKTRYGGFTIPMVILTVVNSMAVVYWGILTRLLPAKRAAQKDGPEVDAEEGADVEAAKAQQPYMQFKEQADQDRQARLR